MSRNLTERGEEMGFRAAREKSGMTQQQAADILKVQRTTVAMWETEKSLPRAELLPTIAKTYGCEIVDLFKK